VTFLNAVFLFGLAAVAIPPVVHLLNRRRYETVPWAAVMFLPDSTTTQQRFRFQHFPLMILRMGLLAVLVLAFAAPQFRGCHANPSNRSKPRDILILIDGSASMGRGVPGQTSAERAKAYIQKWLDDLGTSQRVAIWVARQRTIPVLEEFTSNRELARNSLELIPPPSGVVDWPAAIQQANVLLEARSGECDIVILSDDQRFGWADAETFSKWGLLAQSNNPRIPVHVISLPAISSGEATNAQLEPIRTERATAVAGREIPFRSTVRFSQMPFPTTVKISVDGLPVNSIHIAPHEGEISAPISYAHRFPAGFHLITFELSEDAFAGDNRQDYALEVLPVIPVLMIDGSPEGSRRSSDFLRDALAPPKDSTPAFFIRTVAVSEWQSGLLQRQLGGPNTAPRAVALINIDKLTTDQTRQIETFLSDGGSVFVALGENGDVAAWNRISYRGGEGFLPARVLNIVEEVTTDSRTQVSRLELSTLSHPALDIFKEPLPGGLATAVFPKYWKLDPNAGLRGSTGSTIAAFTNRDPWLIESSFGSGRVIMSAHPFDDSWKTNLHRLPDFVRLSHELFHYLSGTRALQRNLAPGQPILFRPSGGESPGEVRIRFPDGRILHRLANAWPMVMETDGEPGAYQLTTALGRQYWYAVGYDARESDFTPNSPEDRARVAEAVGHLRYVSETEALRFEDRGTPQPWNLWWILLVVVLGVLFAEVFMTRKLVRSGEHAVPGEERDR